MVDPDKNSLMCLWPSVHIPNTGAGAHDGFCPYSDTGGCVTSPEPDCRVYYVKKGKWRLYIYAPALGAESKLASSTNRRSSLLLTLQLCRSSSRRRPVLGVVRRGVLSAGSAGPSARKVSNSDNN